MSVATEYISMWSGKEKHDQGFNWQDKAKQ